MDDFRNEKYDAVVAVVRGGMTAAHYIAKELRVPCGVYFPPTSEHDSIMVLKDHPKKILFVEDLVAQGRTYDTIVDTMKSEHVSDIEWDFFPLVVDATYEKTDFKYYGVKTADWIVFPYEDMDKMKEGDRGLFRENTDVYGKE